VWGQWLQPKASTPRCSVFCNFTRAGYNCSLTVMTQPNPLPFRANVSFIISDYSERNCGYSEFFSWKYKHTCALIWFCFCLSGCTMALILQDTISKFTISSGSCGSSAHIKKIIHVQSSFKADTTQWNVNRKGRSTHPHFTMYYSCVMQATTLPWMANDSADSTHLHLSEKSGQNCSNVTMHPLWSN